MNTIQPSPPSPRPLPSMATRKHLAPDSGPTRTSYGSPKSNSDSAVQGLSPSPASPASPAPGPLPRQNWVQATFAPFLPDKRLEAEVTLAGVHTVCVGPHMFVNTSFYNVLHSTSANQPSSLPSRPKAQMILHFKENPGPRWLFPSDSSLEFCPANEKEPARISASFYPPMTLDHHRPRELTRMTILNATHALWESLEASLGHPVPVQHISASELTRVPRHGELSPSLHPPSKRKQDKVEQEPSKVKSKRPKAAQDEKTLTSTWAKGDDNCGNPKKTSALPGSSSGDHQKRCAYCGCTTTPMWRRGPDGPSTLCNACGVKWKHGKILQDSPGKPVVRKSVKPASTLPSPNPVDGPSTAKKTLVKSKSLENGHVRGYSAIEEFKSPIRATHKRDSTTTSRRHDVAGGSDRTSSTDYHSSRVSDIERIVPVKKRHSNKVSTTIPHGPKMVPIHELSSSSGPSVPRPRVTKEEYDAPVRASQHRDQITSTDPPEPRTGVIPNQRTSQPTSPNTKNPSPPVEQPKALNHGKDLYKTNNLYANNTATFPLHFPTISIAFGPNNAHYTYPNCAVVLFENHFQIKLVQGGERTEIDVWKEGIEGTEFEMVDVGDGESMIVMKALLRQYLTRFDKELLNPDRQESLIVFRFRERLDGGGPPVKPLLEQWLTTDIPAPV